MSPPRVHGKIVRELNVLISPSAFLITREDGTRDFGRLFYQGERYVVGVEQSRLGSHTVTSAELDDRGLTVGTDKGARVLVPWTRLQATYLP